MSAYAAMAPPPSVQYSRQPSLTRRYAGRTMMANAPSHVTIAAAALPIQMDAADTGFVTKNDSRFSVTSRPIDDTPSATAKEIVYAAARKLATVAMANCRFWRTASAAAKGI